MQLLIPNSEKVGYQWSARNKLFSGACPGQNRNWNILGLFCAFVNLEAISIKKINHFFFESGHSQNENDAVHSVIERSAKRVQVFVPEQWYTLIRSASKKKSYNVIELHQSQNFDFADVSCQIVSRRSTAKISKMQIMSYQHWAVNYCYSALDPSVPLDASFKRIKQINYKRLNEESLKPIKKDKKKDLLNLCQKLAIPRTYHAFYQSLKEKTDAASEE